MYDIRDKSVVCSLDHGAPVESVLFLPTGSVFITAGTYLSSRPNLRTIRLLIVLFQAEKKYVFGTRSPEHC